MELNLNRVDYVQVDATSPHCMTLLQAGNKKDALSQIVVGDQNGVLQVFSMKRRDPVHAFKSLRGNKISRVCLGGPSGGVRDKIFLAQGSQVKGYNKKGKEFLSFETTLSEPIRSMYIEGTELVVCGGFIFQRYSDLRDRDYYYSADKINDIVCLPLEASSSVEDLLPILACDDRVLRVLKGSAVLYEVEVPGPPTVLELFCNTGGEDGDEVLYGTADGRLGLVQISKLEPTHRWEVPNDRRHGGILCLDNYDITADGVADLLVGRDDGLVEVYGYDEADEPVLRYSHAYNESVTAVRGGKVATADFDEIICSTYSGWISSLTTEPQQKQVSSNGIVKGNNDSQQKIGTLKKELEDLQGRVEQERQKYHAASTDKKAVSAVPQFNINDKFVLNREDASYSLSIEVQTPIDNMLVQSDVPVDLLDVEKNSAVVSYSTCDPELGNFLLATYRCQSNTTRLDVKVRSIEGQYGTLRAYITLSVLPKVCQLREYSIKPLSLHQRTHNFDESRPHNSLKLTGQFSLSEVHNWLTFCLPELPERVPAGDEASFYFSSTFLDTQLSCQYKKGEAIFKSDNVSTISILKDVLSKEATKKKIRLDVSYEINDQSIAHTLSLLHGKLEYQLLLAKKIQLIDGLRELQSNEGDLSFMAAEYKQILADADRLMAEFKKQPCHLERLYGMITDLFIDMYKFKGQNVKSKVPMLLECLDNYDPQSLLVFFQTAGGNLGG